MAENVCATPGCGKVAAMQCPTCIKLEIVEGSHFCTQDCFKQSWETHKALHKKAKEAAAMAAGPIVWPGYKFTGPLRPWPQSPKRVVPAHIPRPDYADEPDGFPISESKIKSQNVIKCLNKEEIEIMRTAGRLAREIQDICAQAVRVGVTTDEIDRVCHEACIERNCYPSPLNYHQFPKSVCTSVNEVICHGIPDGYKLKDGDIVNVDVSIYYKGFHSDMNETYAVGNVDEAGKKLIRAAYNSLMNAIAACKPDVRYRDMGDIITEHVHAQGFSVVRAFCGHGINDLFHAPPNVPHYAKNKQVGVMKPGHTFTIEPMVNEGTFHEEMWPDGWTATTRDGKRSAQFEHTLLITEDGVEILTARLPTSPKGPHWVIED